MYDNIGGKIKGLAKVIFIIEVIAAVIAGFAIIAIDKYLALIGLLVMAVGATAAWISSWFLYGFGELIEKTCEIARNTRGGVSKSEVQSRVDYDRISKIEKLRSQGLIAEEEYRQAISKEL